MQLFSSTPVFACVPTASFCMTLPVPSLQAQSVGYEESMVSEESPPHDVIIDIAAKVLSQCSDVNWVVGLLRQMGDTQVDPMQVVEVVEARRNMLLPC